MPLNFCAIDFETANAFRGSPCAVGLAKVKDGQVVETHRRLMRPPMGYAQFDDFNVMLHGITSAMVANERRFEDVLPDILAFAEGAPLVAHNTAFDIGVIRDAATVSGIVWPRVEYACTLVLSRRTWDLMSYSLPWVADEAGVTLGEHHNPEADAIAAASVMNAIARKHSADTLGALLSTTAVRAGFLAPGAWRGCHHRSGVSSPTVPEPNEEANTDHPLYGREVVFTGTLQSMTRADAWARLAAVGGRPASGVTKSTNVLVVGYQDARVLRPGASLSAKAQKVRTLRAAGRDIELMGEVDFLQQLSG